MNDATRLPRLELDIYFDHRFVRSMSIDLATEPGLAEVVRDVPATSHLPSMPTPLSPDGQKRLSLHFYPPPTSPLCQCAVTSYFYDASTNPPTLSVKNPKVVNERTPPVPPDEPCVVE